MADLLIDHQGAPTAPASGKSVVMLDNNSGALSRYSSAGRLWGRDKNWSTAAQSPSAATDTYLAGSNLLIPSVGLQVGTRLLWYISASKTAASTATAAFAVRIGSGLSTSDTSRLTLTMGAQTAAVDIGILMLLLSVRSIGATGVLQGTVTIAHSAATATGFGNPVEATAAGFDMTALAGQSVGLSLNTGASAAWTITQVQSEIDY